MRMWFTVIFIAAELLAFLIAAICNIPVLIISTGIFAVYLVFMLWYIKSYVNRYTVRLSDGEIITERGNWFYCRRVISRLAVNYCEVRTGIIGRRFKMCCVRIYLAKRIAVLYGITTETAEEIIRYIEAEAQ